MQTQAKTSNNENRDHDMDEELADVLTAISVVAKRLARKLTMLSKEKSEGGKSDEQDE
jgi:NTP pyrophosphatase (non-canonical NTP hydrolase)